MHLTQSTGQNSPMVAVIKATPKTEKSPDHSPFEGAVHGDIEGADSDIRSELSVSGERELGSEPQNPSLAPTGSSTDTDEPLTVTEAVPKHPTGDAAEQPVSPAGQERPGTALSSPGQNSDLEQRAAGKATLITAMEHVLSHQVASDRAIVSVESNGLVDRSTALRAEPAATAKNGLAVHSQATVPRTAHSVDGTMDTSETSSSRTGGEAPLSALTTANGQRLASTQGRSAQAVQTADVVLRSADLSRAAGLSTGQNPDVQTGATQKHGSHTALQSGKMPTGTHESASFQVNQEQSNLADGRTFRHAEDAIHRGRSPKEAVHPHQSNATVMTPNTPLAEQASVQTSILAQIVDARKTELWPTRLEPTQDFKEFIWDIRPSATNASAQLTPIISRAELPQHLSQAIAQVFQKAPDKPVEIALNPAELGRVRLVMSAHDAGITILVSAERGDTLDLMRRNIDELGRSLADIGFEDVSFAFEQQQDQTDQREPAAGDAIGHLHADETPVLQHATAPDTQISAVMISGIDMRF